MPNEPELFACSCGEEVSEDDTYSAPDGHEIICSDCYDNLVITCTWCMNDEWRDSSYSFQRDPICENCWYENVYHCEHCGEAVHRDDMYYNNDDMGLCFPCYEDSDAHWVRRWGDKPAPMFVHTTGVPISVPRQNAYYFGMEIEVEAGTGDTIQTILRETHDTIGSVYYTTDGSLMNGIEVVTNPGTFDAWREGKVIHWDKWERHLHNVVPDQKQFTSNGIHIHVSRTAFNNKKGVYSTAHVYKFLHFFQHHKDTIEVIAGRGEADYCRWNFNRDLELRLNDAKGKAGTRFDRYRPINTQNEHTIEVRIFDGRTDKPFMMRAIEFLHSVIEYTRSIRKLTDWSDYTDYVRDHKDLYPELWDTLERDPDLLIIGMASKLRNKRAAKEMYKRINEQRNAERMERLRYEASMRAAGLVTESYEEYTAASENGGCDCALCRSW